MRDEVLTARLRLRRPAEPADAGRYERLLLAPGVQRWLRPPPLRPFDAAGARDLLGRDAARWAQDGVGPWVALLRAGEDLVGRVGLQPALVEGEPALEAAWAVLPEHQGQGLATEAALAAVDAARELGAEELVAMTLVDNVASRRVMERAGFAFDRPIEHAGLPHVLYRRAP